MGGGGTAFKLCAQVGFIKLFLFSFNLSSFQVRIPKFEPENNLN